MAEQSAVGLRPTVIVGLGGQGTRIAVALKARLEERFADQIDYPYDNLIRFICIDTSKESFDATRPNQAKADRVRLEPEEMLRIGDLNLDDIRQAPDQSQLAALLPERLFGSQIYLGAQQIRRLGRVALLNYYDRVESKIRQAIITVMHKENIGRQVGGSLISSEGRLRFFVICSVCGGTGSGTFIDVAYLIRDVARQTVTAKCDITGVFLLPEALPEVSEGTGKARIRANAYASLLDLEYFNQDMPEGEALYKVPVGKPREIPGQPFDNAYLIQPGGKTTLRGMEEIAPIVADALDTMICTRLGEQLDATLDNVRHKFIDYHEGFRTFYSALGIAQIVYPKEWVQRQAEIRLKNAIIDNHLIGLSPREREDVRPLEIETWWRDLQRILRDLLNGSARPLSQEALDNMAGDLKPLPDTESIVRRLVTIKRDLENSSIPADDLRRAAVTTFDALERNYRIVRDQNQAVALRYARLWLEKTIHNHLETGWKDKQGLQAVHEWLLEIRNLMDEMLVRNEQPFDDNQTKVINDAVRGVERVEALPFLLLRAQREQAKKEADRLRIRISNEWITGLMDKALVSLFSELHDFVEQMIDRVQLAIRFWKNLRSPEEEPRNFKMSSTIEIVPPREGGKLEEAIDRLFNEAYQLVNSKQPEKLFPIDKFPKQAAEAHDPYQQKALQEALEAWCKSNIGEEVEQPSVISYLDDDWGQSLAEKAVPLLNYRSDYLQTRKPIDIRILGINSDEEINASQRLNVDLSTFSKVETGESSQVTMLSTSHAIPFIALAGFNEYRDNYRQLLNERNAIFHLDNERENEPFDPSFEQFVNINEFEGVFARALAHRWVWYNHADNTYYLTGQFYAVFAEVILAQINKWERLRAQVRADLPSYQRSLDDYEKLIEKLEAAQSALVYAGSEHIPERSDTIYLLSPQKGTLISNLSDAFRAIYQNPAPMFARLFESTAGRLEKEIPDHIRLNAVNRLINEWQGPDTLRRNTFSSSLTGPKTGILITDEPLLRRLLLQLRAYAHLENKTRRMNEPRYMWWDKDAPHQEDGV